MKINTTNFGFITVEDHMIIDFKEGIPGFEEAKQFVIIQNEEDQPFSYLQSVSMEEVCLTLVSPFTIDQDYRMDIDEKELTILGEIDEYSLSVHTVVVVPSQVEEMTANFMAPILINNKTMLGAQLPQSKSEYKVNHKIYKLLVEALAREAEVC